MAKPPIPIGSWGEISTWVAKTDDRGRPVKYKSQAKFRDHDGHVRQVSTFSKTKTGAERALLNKLQDRAKTNRSGELTAMHKINHLLDLWEKRVEGLIIDGKRSPTPSTPTAAPSRTTSARPSANSASAKPPPHASTQSSPRSRPPPAPPPPRPAAPSCPAP
jgi:hypothetical protein